MAVMERLIKREINFPLFSSSHCIPLMYGLVKTGSTRPGHETEILPQFVLFIITILCILCRSHTAQTAHTQTCGYIITKPAGSLCERSSGTFCLFGLFYYVVGKVLGKTQRNSYLNSTDEATPGSHTKSHGGLAALLLHGPSLQVENPPVVLVVGGAQLLPHLLLVLGVDVVVHAGAEPVALCVVEDGSDAV